jgi:pyruvate kinase
MESDVNEADESTSDINTDALLDATNSDTNKASLKSEDDSLGQAIQLIAKIETPEAVESIDAILAASDGVYFCKAELEAELSCRSGANSAGFQSEACKVAIAQKLVIAKANLAGKPVMIGSPLLASLSTRGRPDAEIPTPLSADGASWAVEAAVNGPTQAEQIEMMNSVLDGADSFALTAETSTGLRPATAVHWLHGCILEAEAVMDHWSSYKNLVRSTELPISAHEAVAAAAVAAAHEQRAALIIVVTTTGLAGRFVAKYRPNVPVLLVCESHRVCRQAYLSRGLVPMVRRTKRAPAMSTAASVLVDP